MKPTPAQATDLRTLGVFMVGISVGICLMLIYMGLRDRNVVLTTVVDPAAHIEDD